MTVPSSSDAFDYTTVGYIPPFGKLFPGSFGEGFIYRGSPA
jgi:hypothetical protein